MLSRKSTSMLLGLTLTEHPLMRLLPVEAEGNYHQFYFIHESRDPSKLPFTFITHRNREVKLALLKKHLWSIFLKIRPFTAFSAFAAVTFMLKNNLKNGACEVPSEDNQFTMGEEKKAILPVPIPAFTETIPWKILLMMTTMILILVAEHLWLRWIPKPQSWPDNQVWLMNCWVRSTPDSEMGWQVDPLILLNVPVQAAVR